MKLYFITTATKLNMYSKGIIEKIGDNAIAILPKGHKERLKKEWIDKFSIIAEFDGDVTLTNQFERYYDDQQEVRIISMSEEMLLEVALLRDKYNIPGMGFKETIIFRDKLEMKNHLKAYDIKMSNFLPFKFSEESFESLSNKLGIPFVIKPRLAFGASGFYKINDVIHYNKALKEIASNGEEYLCEGYIKGELYHCESIVKQGEVIFSKVAKYSVPNADFKNQKPIISSFLASESEMSKRIKKFSQKILYSMKLNKGITHLEIFHTKEDELYFLEIGARTPGALIVPLYEKQFGINLLDIGFMLEIDEDFDLKINESNKHFATGMFPRGFGEVKGLKYPDIDCEFDLEHFIEVGEIMNGANQIRDIAASIVCHHSDNNKLQKDIDSLMTFTPWE